MIALKNGVAKLSALLRTRPSHFNWCEPMHGGGRPFDREPTQ